MNKEEVIDKAIGETEVLKKILTKKKIRHVNKEEELSLIKATAYSWLKTHHQELNDIKDLELTNINDNYHTLLKYSSTRTVRKLYINLLTILKKDLVSLRSEVIKKITTGDSIVLNNRPSKPIFSTLISDPKMISILDRRWNEIENCLDHEAPLASTVMMGGLLEAILLARINIITDKRILFKQKSTPIDSETKKPKELSKWMLKDFIDVMSEIGLITKPSAQFCRIIRDYRNYVHPEKELSQGENIEICDAKLFWVVIANLLLQLLATSKL